jgi:hypothetical protein
MDVISKAIDPARIGLSKSLMTTPCERQGFYKEAVRDSTGKRLSFPMPERVLFGRFIDAAHSFLVSAEVRGVPVVVNQAIEVGLEAAHEIEASEEVDWDTFLTQGENALTLFFEQSEGIANMRERYAHNLRFQGDNGRTLHYEDVIGTPDYMDDFGPIDVKTTTRSYDPSKFYRSAEMPIYALLWAAEHGGEVPKLLAYHIYVRKAKPEWKWMETIGTAGQVELGKLYANRWRKGLATNDPDLMGFDTTYCGDCPFRLPIEGLHDGCPIGAVVPIEEIA